MLTARMTFQSGGETLVGQLYSPNRANRPWPTIIVTGSWTTVKEQMPAVYAKRLAEAGYAAFTFDFRNWGESSGNPRSYESPALKIEDIQNAARHLRQVPAVDPDRIGALAICASAGYMAHAIANGAPIHSLALVAAWLHDPETVIPLYGGEADVRRRIEAGRKARQRFERTGEVDYVPAYDPTDPDAGMFFPLDYYALPERGAVPQWSNRFAVMSWVDWLTFDALRAASGVNVPTLMVHSDGAALPDNARRFFAELPGPKHLYWTDGTQTDFYDLEPFVSRSVAAAVEHFAETLGAPAGARGIDAATAQAEITDTVASLLLGVDALDWERVRGVLHDPIHTDYTSLFGGTPVTQHAQDLIGAWRGLLPGFDSTQHLAGPLVAEVEDGKARARCAITGVHRLGTAYWTVGGHYEMELLRQAGGWEISSLTLHTSWVQGDTGLVEEAQARVASNHERAVPAFSGSADS